MSRIWRPLVEQPTCSELVILVHPHHHGTGACPHLCMPVIHSARIAIFDAQSIEQWGSGHSHWCSLPLPLPLPGYQDQAYGAGWRHEYHELPQQHILVSVFHPGLHAMASGDVMGIMTFEARSVPPALACSNGITHWAPIPALP